MTQPTPVVERVIGLDAHPDSFTAARILGQTPAQAIVEILFNKVPIAQLKKWAEKHTTPQDTVVLEASGNSFEIARTLQGLGRKVFVLESCQLGKLKEAHANNDKISAVRIGKAFLSGTAKTVWIPDPQTQDRRDWFHAHRKTVKRFTQTVNRLGSYLSDNGVRLETSLKDLDPALALAQIGAARIWTPSQKIVIQTFLMEMEAARKQREQWESLMALEVATDPMLLSLVRLCGVRDVVAFALGAILGDIRRFSQPKKLVKFVGLNPAFDDSGNQTWTGGIGGHGRKDLRSLLIESAHSILRSKSPLAKWGKKLLARKGSVNLTVAALARKLTVAVWYLMSGKTDELKEMTPPLALKIGKIISRVGDQALASAGQTRKTLRQQMQQSLKTGRVYHLDAHKNFEPKPKAQPEPSSCPATLAQEYRLA
jgi:transposase